VAAEGGRKGAAVAKKGYGGLRMRATVERILRIARVRCGSPKPELGMGF
jgi:hypothetical protein